MRYLSIPYAEDINRVLQVRYHPTAKAVSFLAHGIIKTLRFHGVSQEDTFVLKELLQKAPLTDREHIAIELYDLQGLLLKDLANLFKVSVERVSKIRKQALKKLNRAS